MEMDKILLIEKIREEVEDITVAYLSLAPEQNDRIQAEFNAGKRLFFKGGTYQDSDVVSNNLVKKGFESFSSDNNYYSFEYYKKYNNYNVTVSYIEHDIYLNIFLTNDCFNEYKLY